MVETEVVACSGQSPIRYGLEPAPFVAAEALFWLFNPWLVPLKFLDFSSFWIAPHLLIRSKFTSPVVFLTHIFSPAFCLSSAQKRSLNGQSPPALPQFRQVLLAGWLGIEGHLRFLQQLT